MIKTIITCDRCKCEVNKASSQPLSIDLRMGQSLLKSYPFLDNYKDICNLCIENILSKLEFKLKEV